MRKKIVVFLCMLFITTQFSFCVNAGDEGNPEIKDKRWDVKLFGLIGGLPQFFFKHIDIISGWFYEDSNEPDYLFICLKLRNLKDTSETFEALYSVFWIYNHESYQTIIKIHSDGIFGSFYILDADDMIYSCEGDIDTENNIIIWKVLKENIGYPEIGDVITSTSAYSLLRLYNDGKEGADLFKDLTNRLIGPSSERYGENYIIKY